MEKAYLNWSSGKDAAFALYRATQSGLWDVQTLFSVVKKGCSKLAMHEISVELLKKQAEAIGIPLTILHLDVSDPTAAYKAAMQRQMEQFKAQGISASLFGDLYLEELRKNRQRNCNTAGIKAVFPLWNLPGKAMMEEFLRLGFKAIVTCIDHAALDDSFVGRIIDAEFLQDLPSNVDICGENGEYHSFVFDGPIFKHPVQVRVRRKYWQDYPNPEGCAVSRYWYVELE